MESSDVAHFEQPLLRSEGENASNVVEHVSVRNGAREEFGADLEARRCGQASKCFAAWLGLPPFDASDDGLGGTGPPSQLALTQPCASTGFADEASGVQAGNHVRDDS